MGRAGFLQLFVNFPFRLSQTPDLCYNGCKAKKEALGGMRELVREIVHSLEAGQAVELVTVMEASGSTPRGAGAMMAVFEGGRSAGTVGGGNVEYEAQRLAAELLKTGGGAACRA